MNHEKTMKTNWCLINVETGEILAMNRDINILFNLGFELKKLDEALVLAVI